MSENNQMLICDALDERDFLRKKIITAIKNAKFVDAKRVKDSKVSGVIEVNKFEEDAKSDYQSIKDMIKRYQDIDVAITMSNATTILKTRSGKEMTVAAAIALRKIFNGSGAVQSDFTGMLIEQMTAQYENATSNVQVYDRKANSELENYKANLVGRDTSKKLTEDETAAVEKLVENLYGQLVDPLNIKDEIEKISDEHLTLMKELDTAIKISNASTYITV